MQNIVMVDAAPLEASRFDAVWYLANYPDVAASGSDPYDHFCCHGQFEGRLPFQTEAIRLEALLWAGFSQYAEAALLELYCNTRIPFERHYVGWVLARWFASYGLWDKALEFDADLGAFSRSLIHVLLRLDVLLRCGRLADAHFAMDQAFSVWGVIPDLSLLSANLRVCTADAASCDDSWFESVNRIFLAAGLAPIAKASPDKALGFDNLGPASYLQAPADQVLISVVMPASNAAEYIGTALRGLLAQTWSNLEVIVVDDASVDGTADVVAALASTDARIRLFRLPQQSGAYVARNFALQQVRGDLITNHDSDDWSHPQRLECLALGLLSDSNCMGVMAYWVRADERLYFQRWRTERSLIHPTVSTLMLRREVFSALGGWDEVRVGADTELWQRTLTLFGKAAVREILPGIPLAFARQLPNSLTSAPSTHIRTHIHGLRRQYHELSQRWHELARQPAGLYLSPLPTERRFPAPLGMLLQPFPMVPDCDLLLMADLGEGGLHFADVKAVVLAWVRQGLRVALFHWPDVREKLPSSIAHCFLDLALFGEVSLHLGGDRVKAKTVVLMGLDLLVIPPDLQPLADSVDFRTVDFHRVPARLADLNETVNQEPLLSLLRDSEWFDAEWYLKTNPDVAKAGLDPAMHYLNYGTLEGRNPGPGFQSAAYLKHCPWADASAHPPLLHYHQSGKKLGYDPFVASFPGKLAFNPEARTVLLCAHDAGRTLAGAEQSFIDLLDLYQILGINVIATVPQVVNPSYMSNVLERAHILYHVPTQFWSLHIPPHPSIVARFVAIIKEHQIEVVHVNTIVLHEPLLAGKQCGVTTILHARESLSEDKDICELIGGSVSEIKAALFKSVDRVIANSNYTAGNFYIPGETYIVPNTLDMCVFDLPNIVDPECIKVALVSSNIEKKGVADFVRIATELEQCLPNVRFLLIGQETSLVADFRQRQAAGDLPTNIEFVGYISNPVDAIRQANIIVNLSHFGESFGRTTLEAMAARRPVVAYHHGALPELIEDGVNGYLVPYLDIPAFCQSLCDLCRNLPRILSFGECGREMAVNFWNRRRAVEMLSSALSE